MKKLVLGIISVFVTQVFFVAYNWTGDELTADVGRVTEYTIEKEYWPAIRSVRPPYPETMAKAAEIVIESVKPVVVVAPKPEIASYKPVPKLTKRNYIVKNDIKFEPTVITYSTVPVKFTERPQIASVPETETVKSTSAQAPIKKKRSFLQKTGSVIKKPFVWIKNLVAKMD